MPGKDFDDYMKRFEQLAAKYVPPKKDWFWVAAGLIMLMPTAIIALFKPYETRVKELEEIEEKR